MLCRLHQTTALPTPQREVHKASRRERRDLTEDSRFGWLHSFTPAGPAFLSGEVVKGSSEEERSGWERSRSLPKPTPCSQCSRLSQLGVGATEMKEQDLAPALAGLSGCRVERALKQNGECWWAGGWDTDPRPPPCSKSSFSHCQTHLDHPSPAPSLL